MTDDKINELSWMIGGPQGSGVDSSARLFALACANGGLNVFGKREYYSNIKGEHSYFGIRVDRRLVRSSVDAVHVLATFEAETLLRHLYSGEVVPGGCAIFDPKDLEAKIEGIGTLEHRLKDEILEDLGSRNLPPVVGSVVEDAKKNGIKAFALPYQEILKQVADAIGETQPSKLLILKNTIAVGASFGVLGYEMETVQATIEDIFGSKSEKIKQMNRVAVEKGYEYAAKNFDKIGWSLRRRKNPPDYPRIYLTGTQAVGLGKIAAGCRLQTYYPITPATDESEFLESHPQGRVVVMQAEDEMAAAAMAVSGNLAGARSSTSTSGPGFNLMAEVQAWAGINEVPLVIVNYQRGGPSTGLPTRHEQGDLKFTLNMGHGDLPKIVLAPGDLEESFYQAVDAFNYAEKYQLVVFLLSDKNLANNSGTIKAFDLAPLQVERGKLLTAEECLAYTKEDFHFPRFLPEDDGISPRAALGTKGGIHWLTGDEHTVQGHITEDPDLRVMMMTKRMDKEVLAAAQIPADKKFNLFGDPDAPITLVSWGSTKGAILDAMVRFEEEGLKVNFLQVKLLWPFPTAEVEAILKKSTTIVNIEMNYSAQFAQLLRQQTGIKPHHNVLKFNGRPMTEDEIFNGVKRVVAEKKEKEVLTYGV